jgi:hypothetical protein
MSIQRKITDIPDDQVDDVIKDFESEACTAEKQKQPDGNWTVVATCPEQSP